jgi:exodeoxyribonuclease V alpha subunit
MFLDYSVKNIETDVVIVDEASMIDTLMMNNLLKAINSKTSVIFVGDVNQLPSVGPGSVLKDIIDSGIVKTVFLNEIYRQSASSDIIINAHKVNKGEYPVFKNKDTDLYYIKTNSIEDTVTELSSLISFRLDNFAKMDVMKDLQILTPTKKNELRNI